MPEQEPIEKRGPFEVVGRTIIHDRFGMQLIGDRIRHPDGSAGEYFWVNFKREAVLIFPYDDVGNMYLSEEFTYATNAYLTEVAGGSLEEDESPEEAAKRKVRQELGIETESIHYLGRVGEITSRVNNISHLFLTKVASVGESQPGPADIIRLRKVPIDQAYQMALTGEISTATVAIGIIRAKQVLDQLNQ